MSGPGVSDTSIRLGVLTDESGPNKAFAVARLRAARVFFQALNDDGGLNGRRVDLVVADHQFNRDIAVREYLAMRDSILMVAHVYPMAFLEDDLARDEVLASPFGFEAHRLALEVTQLGLGGFELAVLLGQEGDEIMGPLPHCRTPPVFRFKARRRRSGWPPPPKEPRILPPRFRDSNPTDRRSPAAS